MLIKQNKKVQIDIGPENVTMYECTGKVHSAFSFANINQGILSEIGSSILKENLSILETEEAIPNDLNTCLARTDGLKLNDNTFLIKRSGARSAYWKERNIKFKGCRPMVKEPATFPMEKLAFGADTIEYGDIPFGVITKEAILREILAYCFFKETNLPVAHIPLCVYEYMQEKRTIGFCLVLQSVGETRVEQFINYPELTINELVQIKSQNLETKYFVGSELNLSGINVHRYSDEKARLLTKIHFSGGFRGILNSNIGNDIVLGNDNFKLLICDFDTFEVLEMPDQPDFEFLKGFVLQCVIEVLKGSISILEYIQFKDGLPVADQNRILFERYTKISSLWKAYERCFWICVKDNGWNEKLVKQAFESILETQALFKILSLVIPNSKSVREIISNRNVFYSHN